MFQGAIFGWGTNGAYVEDISNISKLPGSAQYPPGTKMLVNTEWCAFDNEVIFRDDIMLRYMLTSNIGHSGEYYHLPPSMFNRTRLPLTQAFRPSKS